MTYLLSELIKIPSFSENEGQLAEFLLRYLRKKGIAAIMQGENVLVHFSGKNSSAIIFNAHMDTVSAGDHELWKYPPFSGIEKNGKIYGLGASDDKGGVMSLLLLAEYLQKNPPDCDVWITFVTQEETDGSGTISFLSYFSHYKKNYKHIAAIVAEGTNAHTIEVGHRGSIKIKLTTKGDSGHGSRPHEIKTHTIEVMTQVITKMREIEIDVKKEFIDERLGFPSFALTGISSNETSLNKIPNICYSTWDIRTTPNFHFLVVSFLQEKLGNTVEVEQIELHGHPPSIIKETEYIVTVFQTVYPEIDITVTAGTNDMHFFINENIPALSFGPGIKSVIHKENEYIEIKNIQTAFEIYQKVIKVFADTTL